jgi:hypothetical protein
LLIREIQRYPNWVGWSVAEAHHMGRFLVFTVPAVTFKSQNLSISSAYLMPSSWVVVAFMLMFQYIMPAISRL